MARNGMVIDLDRCTGCRACMVACKVENNTPEGHLWMYVFRFEEGAFPNTRIGFAPRPCMHCDNPPCEKVCPVGARFTREEDRHVLTDWDRCIGCRYCEVACPYGVNCFNWRDPDRGHYLDWSAPEVVERTGGANPPYRNPDLQRRYGEEPRYVAGGGQQSGVIGKCTFCVHRVEKGLLPACVTSCPVDALIFGDLDDPSSDVSKVLAVKASSRMLEELGTEPKVHYVGSRRPPGEHAREIEAVPRRSTDTGRQ